MKNTKSIVLLLTGAAIGMGLAGPATNAAAEFFQAQRTPHPIYVDGQQVQMEAYAINGSNYVKLREIGQAVGFEVYWDGLAAQIISDKPYTGRLPMQVEVSTNPNTQADPAAFTGYLTAEVYNTIREAVLTKQDTSFGSVVQGFLHLKWEDEEGIRRAEEETQQINQQMMQVFTEFGSMRQLSPEAERAQKQVKKLQAFITKNFYTCSDEILYGLAKMYAGGGAFTETIDTAGGSGTAEFVYQAVKRYCGK